MPKGLEVGACGCAHTSWHLGGRKGKYHMEQLQRWGTGLRWAHLEQSREGMIQGSWLKKVVLIEVAFAAVCAVVKPVKIHVGTWESSQLRLHSGDAPGNDASVHLWFPCMEQRFPSHSRKMEVS